MVNLLTSVIGITAFFKSQTGSLAAVDTRLERLHHQFTAAVLFLSVTFLGLTDIFGTQIMCRSSSGNADNAVNQFCFVHGTYTLPSDNPSDQPDSLKNVVPMDKIPDLKRKFQNEPGSFKKSHGWYQWVPFLLCFQGFLFLIPHKVWEWLEEGRMESILSAVLDANRQPESERQEMIEKVARYVEAKNKCLSYRKYCYGYIFYLCLNVANVVFNIFLSNTFLHGDFLNLGFRWMDASYEVRENLLISIFPRMTICMWETFGSAGGREREFYLCLLSTNNIVEKIFLFLWFWFLFLLIVSLVSLTYFCVMAFSRNHDIRMYFLSFAVRIRLSKFRLKEENGNTEAKGKKRIVKYLKHLPGTNFFFLYFLSRNVDHRFLQDLLKLICEKHKVTLSKMDTLASAPPEDNEIEPAATLWLPHPRDANRVSEREREIEMKEMNEGNDDENDSDEYEEKDNETKSGGKPKKKAEFKDIHAAMSPSRQPREPSPSNLPGQRSPKHQLKLTKEKKHNSNVSPR